MKPKEKLSDVFTSDTPKTKSTTTKPIIKQSNNIENVTSNNIVTTTHTETNINWAAALKNITVPNLVKAGSTLGMGYAGSSLGAGVMTGLGLALLGPGAAAVGYLGGKVLGFGIGAIGGHKFGDFVANTIDDTTTENIVENGKTNICIDSVVEQKKEKEKL